MIKKILIVIGVVLGLIVAVMAASWFGTSGARDQADKLVAAVRDGDEAALGALMSRELAEKAPPAKLLRMARAWGLDDAQTLTWTSWSYGTDGAKLSGSFERKGVAQPLDLRFIKQDAAWKLVKIETKLPEIASDPLTLSVPEPRELVAMAAQVTRDLAVGIRERSLKAVHASMTRGTQAQFTVEDLDTAFAKLIESQVDVSPAIDLQPEFDPPPMIDPSAKLVMEGRYRTRPSPVSFTYKFMREDGQWRLIGLFVNAGQNKDAAN